MNVFGAVTISVVLLIIVRLQFTTYGWLPQVMLSKRVGPKIALSILRSSSAQDDLRSARLGGVFLSLGVGLLVLFGIEEMLLVPVIVAIIAGFWHRKVLLRKTQGAPDSLG